MEIQSINVGKDVSICKNKVVTDEYIQRYKQSTMNALEQILCMGESVNEVYQRVKLGELDRSDLKYFCESVGLDSEGSTFRKYKQIGLNACKFRQYLEKLPATFSVLYEMATLSDEDFERCVVEWKSSYQLTLKDLKQLTKKNSGSIKESGEIPVFKPHHSSIKKALRQINRFTITMDRNLPESTFNNVVDVLDGLRKQGYISFEDPKITQYVTEDDEELDDEDVDLKYFASFKEQDDRELRI